jgi:DNA polymerase
MGLKENELKPLVDAWRTANPNVVRFWWDADKAAKTAVKQKKITETHGIRFSYQSDILFITLPSGRKLAYVKPRIGENRFGSECVTYEGIGAAKKWERIKSSPGKWVENITQAVARDILYYALSAFRRSDVVMHIHDEVVIEADKRMSLAEVCERMSRVPEWAVGLPLRCDGYETDFYKKD